MKRGFTLVELTVSIVILALMIFGIAQLFSRGAEIGRRAEKLTVATNLAQAQIERLTAEGYDDLTAGLYEPRNNVFETYDRQTEIDYIDPDTMTVGIDDLGLKRVTITVFYPTIRGEKNFTLATFFSRL